MQVTEKHPQTYLCMNKCACICITVEGTVGAGKVTEPQYSKQSMLPPLIFIGSQRHSRS